MQVNTIFSDLLKLIPRYEFDNIVEAHNGNYYTKTFTGQQELIVLLFSQIRGQDSLREIETSLRTQNKKWYHIGIKGISRSTLADALKNRTYKIYKDLFYKLLERCRDLSPKHKFRFHNRLFNLDSTLINLCLSLYPWAKYRQAKGAIKLHCLVEQKGTTIPSFIVMSDGLESDIKAAKKRSGIDSELLPDSIIAFDRGYVDFDWLNSLNKRGVFFVTRMKKNILYDQMREYRFYSNKAIIKDVLIELRSAKSRKSYPEKLRLVVYFDKESGKYYEFTTNNMEFSAQTIADIYKNRWEIELFFKWIKQHLQIKSFLGTSVNAVLTQVWVAMCYYLLLNYIKYQTKFALSLWELGLMIREVLMERVNLIDILSLNKYTVKKAREPVPQYALF
jgi:hypothetical protein